MRTVSPMLGDVGAGFAFMSETVYKEAAKDIIFILAISARTIHRPKIVNRSYSYAACQVWKGGLEDSPTAAIYVATGS